MRVISRRTLKEFWEKHSGAEAVLKTWYTRVKRAEWKTPFDVKVDYRNASIIKLEHTTPMIKLMPQRFKE